jgi:hypothetical protein
MNNYVVYMDEINSTLKYLINSSTMEKKRIEIFNVLNYILKRANTIICSDADVSDLVFKYITSLRTINECVYIHNTFKNYSNINAYKSMDINLMIEKIKMKIEKNEGFIACFDQLKFLDKIYYNVFDESKKELFLKISSKDDDFTNTEVWKNKFVFYTPKIIYGNDFVPINRTDIFVFSKGGSIDSLQIVQQATRCRVIQDLYYYIQVKPKFLKYKNINDCKNKINNEKKVHYNILKELGCIEHTEDARTEIKDTIYTEMFIYNEMVDDVLKSNYSYHFEEIILNKGFKIIDLNEMKTTIKKEFTAKAKDGESDKMKEIKELYIDNKLQCKYKQYYDLIENRKKILNINKEDIEKYIDILIYDKDFENHIAISKLFRSMETVNEEYKGEMCEKQIKSIYSKILLIEFIEKILKVERFEFKIIKSLLDNHIEEWNVEYNKKYCNIIKNKHEYDNTYRNLYKIRATLYRSFNKDIIETIILKHKQKQIRDYKVNDRILKFHFELYKRRQNNTKNTNKGISTLLGEDQLDDSLFIE